MLAVAAPVRLVDLAIALLAQDPRQSGAQSLASVCEPTSLDRTVQCSQVRFCQTYWYLSCHTASIPAAGSDEFRLATESKSCGGMATRAGKTEPEVRT